MKHGHHVLMNRLVNLGFEFVLQRCCRKAQVGYEEEGTRSVSISYMIYLLNNVIKECSSTGSRNGVKSSCQLSSPFAYSLPNISW